MADLVLDASVVVALLFAEPLTPQADLLITDAQRRGLRLNAPHLLPFEVTNAIRRRMRRDGLSLDEALTALNFFLALPIDLIVDHELHRQALRLTQAYGLGGQDAHYVALAQRLGCALWTADERLLRALGDRLPQVRFIGEHSSPSNSDST